MYPDERDIPRGITALSRRRRFEKSKQILSEMEKHQLDTQTNLQTQQPQPQPQLQSQSQPQQQPLPQQYYQPSSGVTHHADTSSGFGPQIQPPQQQQQQQQFGATTQTQAVPSFQGQSRNMYTSQPPVSYSFQPQQQQQQQQIPFQTAPLPLPPPTVTQVKKTTKNYSSNMNQTTISPLQLYLACLASIWMFVFCETLSSFYIFPRFGMSIRQTWCTVEDVPNTPFWRTCEEAERFGLTVWNHGKVFESIFVGILLFMLHWVAWKCLIRRRIEYV